MNLSIPTYQTRVDGVFTLTTVGLGPHTRTRSAPSAQKAQHTLVEELRRVVSGLKPSDLVWFQMTRGLRLERARLDLNLRGGGKKRRISGTWPLIVEPRWASDERRFTIAYHPDDQGQWFPVQDDEPLDQQAAAFFQKIWASHDDDDVRKRLSNGKDFLKIVSFSIENRSILDTLPERKKNIWEDLESDPARKKKQRESGQQLLHRLGTDLTNRALEGGLRPGLPRSPQRERLQQLLGGDRKQPVLLVGPSGAGKTALVHQFVHDLIASNDFPSHRNADRIFHVWALGGRRLIAGMSHVGEWEQRCMELLDELRGRKVILYADDVAHFGRIGRSRDSDRCLADLFHGPISRGELQLIGECSPEQLRAMEDDAPTFTSLFARVQVPPATSSETFRILLHEARQLEMQRDGLPISPYALRTALELGGSLFPNHALPGKALEVLRQLAREEHPKELEIVGPHEVVRLLARKTGLPEVLLRPEEPLVAADLAAELARQVIGQPGAVAAACDLILRIKTGLVDPRRPYGVYLFTGPTGTGKTELAKCIADYLYGSSERLLRFDMSEFGGPDGPARLIGDRWQPEGLLTQRVQEQPFCVVLFDEIEKAHPSILNLLLQLFDEGRLTSASGATASFTHAVVIMTSNLGARPTAPVGFGDQGERVLADVARAVREFFPPELFNRIDRIVPFSPLGNQVAAEVAHKEMNRLFNRRGLADRNIFVYAAPSVAERVAREAFAQQDGARSLKRHIEQRIGSVLADHVASGPQAAMQVVRIFEAGDDLQIDIEPLLEAEPASYDFALEPLMNQPLSVLQQHLPAVLGFLRDLEDSDELERLAEQIRFHLEQHNQGSPEHAEQLFNLESIRTELSAFRQRVSELSAVRDEGYELLEIQRFNRTEFNLPGYRASSRDGETVRSRLFDRRMMQPPGRQAARAEVLECLAETEFLRRAIDRVHEPERHAVFIELWRASRGATESRFARESDRLLTWMARAYAGARGDLEEAVLRLTRGDVIELRGTDLAGRMEEWLAQGVDRIVLKVVGLCVLDYFEGETGSHVWQSTADQPEIVQTRVRSAPPGQGARAVLDEYERARRAFDEGLRRGQTPPNPDRLLPAVRRLRYDPPRRQGAVSLVDVEDYVLSYGTGLWVRSLDEALPPLWLLRMSGRPSASASG